MFQPGKGEKLKSSEQIQAIRRAGKAYSNALMVLMVIPNSLAFSRYAVISSRKVGGAVKRNRCKRVLRSRIQKLFPQIDAGFDLLLIARLPLLAGNPLEIDSSVSDLIKRAGLLRNQDAVNP